MSQDITDFIQFTFNGLALSGLYVLVGVGITMIFGLTRIVNFAHGQMLLLGSYVALELTSNDVNFVIAVIAAAIVVALAGFGLDRGLLRHTLQNPLNGFIVSLGVVIVLEVTMDGLWGSETQRVLSPVHGVWEVGDVRFPRDRVMILGVTAALVVLLFALLKWTNLGRSMRAVAEDRTAAALVGVNVGSTITASFLIGSALAGIGGALLGTLISFTPYSGGSLIIKGFFVALIGGLGNVGGASVAGLLLGLAETYGIAYWRSDWQDGFGFGLLILILLVRPQGLFRGVEFLSAEK